MNVLVLVFLGIEFSNGMTKSSFETSEKQENVPIL